jgi:hypothetical protein
MHCHRFINETRYARCFHVIGDRSRHFGRFDCGHAAPAAPPRATGGCC